jgi:hypothetical protein
MMDWKIQARSHACTACSRPFVDKEVYHTVLYDERADFQRCDLCPVCWERAYSDGARDRKGFVSYWQGTYEAPAPQAEAIKKENAETLLRKLAELNDPRNAAAAFILAVMLERKRVLKVKDQVQRESGRVFVYEQPSTGDVFTIADPNLRLDQLDQVQREVAALLEHGVGCAAAPAAAGVEPAATSVETLPVNGLASTPNAPPP